MERSKINLYNGDCMEAMREMPDNAYDLAIVDPPYFEEYGKKNYTGSSISTTNVKRQTKKINHWEVPSKDYFDQLTRVSINQIIWGCNYYATHIKSVGRIVWDKKNESSTFSKCELASHSFGLIVDKFEFMWNGMLQQDMKNKEQRIHPTQKPVKLYEWLLTNYAKEGDKILDTHGGSMSIAIACHNLKFDLDLWELDEDYYKAGVERFEKHKKQLQLF